MNWVFDLNHNAPFVIKTTEAPFYRRIALKRMRESNTRSAEVKTTAVYRGFEIRDGNGIVFVSSTGEVYPSGFLPISCGNVRNHSLVGIYRDSPLFQALHSPTLFQGKCGTCEASQLCGGSRARAFVHTGNPLESDPLCMYQPSEIRSEVFANDVAMAGSKIPG